MNLNDTSTELSVLICLTKAHSKTRFTTIMTLVYIIRHGETEWNLKGIHQGHKDSKLTPKGEEQADCLGQRFKDAGLIFDHIYSSDLGRANETARRICTSINQENLINTTASLRERSLGILEGLTYKEIESNLPDDFKQHISGNPDYTPDGGESWKETQERVGKALEKIAQKHDNKKVLCVTHGGIVSMALRLCLNIPLNEKRKFGIPNTAINIFEYHLEQDWRLRTWGDISHFSDGRVLDEML